MQERKRINWSEFNKPRVLLPQDWKDDKSEKNKYILYSELKQCYDMVLEFCSMHQEFNKKHYTGHNEEKFEVPMNIGIVGERGSGKTSLLKSLKLKLESEQFFVFDIIDPNTLSSELTILEILISNMYDLILHKDDNNGNRRTVREDYSKTKIINQFKRIMSTLAIKREKANFLKKDQPDIDIVEKVRNIVNLDNLIIDLLESFKVYWGQTNDITVKDIVLIIDDLDLIENSYVLKLISEIQEYLNSKIIVVLAYKRSQIEESIIEEKIRTNQILIDHSIIEVEELKRQTEHLLMKLLPVPNRINLYSQVDLLSKNYLDLFASLRLDENYFIDNVLIKEKEALGIKTSSNNKSQEGVNVREWFYQKLLEAILIYLKPIDEKEVDKFFLPNSLREFVQLASIIDSFSYPDSSKSYGENDTIENIQKFRKYFLDRNNSVLKYEERALVESWLLADSYQKNYLVFHYFLDKFETSGTDGKKDGEKVFLKKNYANVPYPFNLSVSESFNLRLGDIYEIMELYKKYVAKTPLDFYLVYFFKILYSLEMTQLLLESYLSIDESKDMDYFKEKESDTKDKSKQIDPKDKMEKFHIERTPTLLSYFQLINTSFMPGNFNYFEYISEREEQDYFIQLKKGDLANSYILDNFITSDVAIKGDVKKATMMDLSSFRYRKLYSIDKTESYRLYTNYMIEFFVPFIKPVNIIHTLMGYKRENKTSFMFLFYSMFQIDVFVRKNYARRSEENRYYYARTRIQGIFKILNKVNNPSSEQETNSSSESDDLIDLIKNVEDYFAYLFKKSGQAYDIPYQVDDETIESFEKEVIPEQGEKNDWTFYDPLFEELVLKTNDKTRENFTADLGQNDIKINDKSFPYRLDIWGKEMVVNLEKRSIKHLVAELRNHEDKLSDDLKKRIQLVNDLYLNKDANTTLRNSKVKKSLYSLLDQFILEYGANSGE